VNFTIVQVVYQVKACFSGFRILYLVILKITKTKSTILEIYLDCLALMERKGEREMAERPDEIQKLVNVAIDMVLPTTVRDDAIKHLGKIGGREAFLALLELAANEQLTKKERDLALKQSREILKSEQ